MEVDGELCVDADGEVDARPPDGGASMMEAATRIRFRPCGRARAQDKPLWSEAFSKVHGARRCSDTAEFYTSRPGTVAVTLQAHPLLTSLASPELSSPLREPDMLLGRRLAA